MKAVCTFLLLSAIIQATFAQDVVSMNKAEQKILIHLNPAADLQLVKSGLNNSSIRVLSNKSWVLNVNTEKNSQPAQTLHVKAASGYYIPVSPDPAGLLSGSPEISSSRSAGTLAINYLSSAVQKVPDNSRSVNVIFTLTNR